MNIIHGLYGEFTKILIWVYIVITMSATIRIFVLIGSCMCFCLFAGITFLFVGYVFYLLKKCKVQNDYRKIEDEFKNILKKMKKNENNFINYSFACNEFVGKGA